MEAIGNDLAQEDDEAKSGETTQGKFWKWCAFLTDFIRTFILIEKVFILICSKNNKSTNQIKFNQKNKIKIYSKLFNYLKEKDWFLYTN